LNRRGDGALHAATNNGDLVVVKTLLEEGADANRANQYVGVGLIEGGAVSHACCCRDGWAPIHSAAANGQLSCLEFLVARGADVHALTK
jgi:ankyrin repeat protein